MSKLEFKPDMYKKTINISGFDCLYTSTECAQQSQQIFDEWLEKQTVVFGFGASDGWGWRTDSRNGETKKAYVVCIEEIKKCEHENVVNDQDMSGRTILDLWRCKDCNKQLKPKNGWEEV